MKKRVIVAYKFKVNTFSVEVIEKSSYGNILVYKKETNNTLFNLFDLDSFIKSTKKEIEKTIASKINDVVVIVQNSSDLSIHKKIILNKSNTSNLTQLDIAKKLYQLEKANKQYLFDYSYIEQKQNENFINLSTLDWNKAKNIFNLFIKNDLNVLRIYDYDFLNNISLDYKKEKGVATLISFEDLSLKIEILKNNICIFKKELKMGIDFLIKLIANHLKISENQAKIELNLWTLNLHAGDSKEIEFLVKKYLFLVEKECSSFNMKLLENQNVKFSCLNSKIASIFNKFDNQIIKLISFNKESIYLNEIISNEMLGIISLIDNNAQNTIKEMTITSELFVLDTYNLENNNYSFNYNK